MKVPFTWKPTGWFMIGWSAQFPVGEVRPLHYFGEELVAYRTDDGALHVMSAHCPHLGAHIGHGGKVNGDCVECPYHGWGYGPDGVNRYIPYEDRPNVSKRLQAWTVLEQYDCVFLWHQPHGEPPRWEMPDIFLSFPQSDTDPAAYYRPYPELSKRYDREPVHPQLPLENAADSIHFQYVHRATVTPVLLDWKVVDQEWRFPTGWPDARSDDPDAMALRIHSWLFGVARSQRSGGSPPSPPYPPAPPPSPTIFFSFCSQKPPPSDPPAAPPTSPASAAGGAARGRFGDPPIPAVPRTTCAPPRSARRPSLGSLRKWEGPPRPTPDGAPPPGKKTT